MKAPTWKQYVEILKGMSAPSQQAPTGESVANEVVNEDPVVNQVVE